MFYELIYSSLNQKPKTIIAHLSVMSFDSVVVALCHNLSLILLPPAPTITIVIMDLHTMTLRDYNCGIDLTDQQYSKCLHEQVVSFDVG